MVIFISNILLDHGIHSPQIQIHAKLRNWQLNCVFQHVTVQWPDASLFTVSSRSSNMLQSLPQHSGTILSCGWNCKVKKMAIQNDSGWNWPPCSFRSLLECPINYY